MADEERTDQPQSYEELDQEWSELLEEHRVALPGTEVLFAFLLILPFQNQFQKLTTHQEYVYFSALLCAATAIILLITPTANHRILWRRHGKNELLVLATRTSIAALVFVSLAMTAAVYLITDFVFGDPTTAIVVAILAGLFGVFWFGMPTLRRLGVLRSIPGAGAPEPPPGGRGSRGR